MAYYSRQIEMPATKRDGLANFVQMIINSIERGSPQEALLQAVDLLNDIQSGIYNSAMTDHAALTAADKAARASIEEASRKHADALVAAREAGIAEGMARQRNDFLARLGLAA